MTEFTKPTGINFSFVDMPAAKLSKLLCQTAGFLQAISPYAKLHRYDDWWEHDGLHFYRGPTDFDRLFGIVNSPRSLLEAMSTDDCVFIGIRSEDNFWYLRFYVYWDDDGFDLMGRFDITTPGQLVEQFRKEIAATADVEIEEEDAETYYESIIS